MLIGDNDDSSGRRALMAELSMIESVDGGSGYKMHQARRSVLESGSGRKT